MNGKYKIAYTYMDGILEITEHDAKILTHINLAFGLIHPDGSLNTGELRHLDRLQLIRSWNPEIKIVLSVGGLGAGGFSHMTSTDAGIGSFVQDCAKFVAEMGLDGIDIDWEYPCLDWAGIDADPADKQNYTKLLRALREVLGPDKIVSVAVGSGEYFTENTEMDQVGLICDYVQLMTYDMRGGGCFTAGHHTSLYPSAGDPERISVEDTVERFCRAGVPMEKMVIGAAFYSRVWHGVTAETTADLSGTALPGLLMPAESDGSYGYSYAELAENYINKNGYVRYYDTAAHAYYLYNGTDFISYDDPESVREKCRYVLNKNLLGIMYWEHGCDKTHALVNSMGEVL